MTEQSLNIPRQYKMGARNKALKITGLYFLFAMLWILLSDYVAKDIVVNEWEFPVAFQTLKGLFFVLVTSGLLLLVLRKSFHAQDQAYKQMYEQERQYRHLLDHLPGFAYRCYNDSYWTMVIVNKCCTQITGYSSKELIGNNVVAYADLIEEKDRKMVEKEVEKAVNNNRRFSICYTIITKEGKRKRVWEQGSLAYEENGKQFLEGYITDVTTIHNLKEELGVKDIYYKMLLENANDAIFVVNIDKENCTLTQFREVNALACQRLNVNKNDLLQMKPMELEIFKNSVNLQKGLKELIKSGNYTFETTYSGPDSQKRYSEVNAHLFEIDNDPVIMAISRDITERVIARTLLEQKNQELKTLLYKSSHDLRSPTTNVLGLTQIAKEELSEHNALEYLELIQQSAEQMLYILESLNTASLTKKDQLQINSIDFRAICNNVLEKNSYLPGYQEVNITTVINEGEKVHSDPQLIECILNNLINNAIEYRNNHHTQIYIHMDAKQGGVDLKVEDNGQGISDAVQSQIFHMFYRGHEYSKGSGLGLYIVKNAVEKLNGEIHLESQEGKGTKFYLYIPSLTNSNAPEMSKI